MNYADISRTLCNFLAAHEAYRRLGYSSDDIYCVTAKSARARGVLSCFAMLKQNDLEFLIECGPLGCTEEEFYEKHTRVCEAVIDGSLSQEVLNRIWKEGEVANSATKLVAALASKGFVSPRALS